VLRLKTTQRFLPTGLSKEDLQRSMTCADPELQVALLEIPSIWPAFPDSHCREVAVDL
jgi:hypothetical protein